MAASTDMVSATEAFSFSGEDVITGTSSFSCSVVVLSVSCSGEGRSGASAKKAEDVVPTYCDKFTGNTTDWWIEMAVIPIKTSEQYNKVDLFVRFKSALDTLDLELGRAALIVLRIILPAVVMHNFCESEFLSTSI
jgi:hypothetical protein